MHDDIGNSRGQGNIMGQGNSTGHSSQTGSVWEQEAAGKIEPRRTGDQLPVELTAAVITVQADQPMVLTRPLGRGPSPGGQGSAVAALPSERYRPSEHDGLEAAMRSRVVAQTGLTLGYVEQLATACDRDAGPPRDTGNAAVGNTAAGASGCHLSIGYLALMRVEGAAKALPWVSCYDILPWEDWRTGRPDILTRVITPGLLAWAANDETCADASAPLQAQLQAQAQLQPQLQPPLQLGRSALSRPDRLRMCFGLDGGRWDDERVVDRLDLLEEAGLGQVGVGHHMRGDHRRILATALARLRAKIRNRPVVFELLPPIFTLFELQKTVEAILGPHLHKQNFRRLVEGTGLVEPTDEVRTHTGGRPAKLFRFRREVMLERPAPGVGVKSGRAA